MINIDYSGGGIRIDTGKLSEIFSKSQLPIIVKIKNLISKKIVWETKLNDGMWASYPNNELNDVIIEDNGGNFIYRYRWDVITHGSIFYKSLWLYCKGLINKGKKPIGVAIGTHDGEFGEWVPLVINHMSDVLLIEGSEEQYNKLCENYSHRLGVSLMNELITPEGEDVNFFEGGRGYTNTIIKRVIDSWETEQITSTRRTSISLKKLLHERFDNKIDWLHLDVEGLDSELLMSVPINNLPDFIIFEDYNLLDNEKNIIYNYLIGNGYNLHSEGGICMCSKLNLLNF